MRTFRIANADLSIERFDQWYLLTSAVILGVTGLGKVPTHVMLTWCMQEPMLGANQPAWVSNMGLSGFAAGIELGIVALILLGPARWLSCLASASWGAVCLAVRFVLFRDGFAHCNCLGWVDAPPVTVAAIAAWLLVRGVIASWQSWRNRGHMPQEPVDLTLTAGILRRLLLWGISAICVYWGLGILLNWANYDEYKELNGPLYLALASPTIAIGAIAGFRGTLPRARLPGIFDIARHMEGAESPAE